MEERLRYDCSGRWLKGSVHVHTTRSSGRLTLDEVVAFYAEAGYDFICITDKLVPYVGGSDDRWPLLVLNGIELEGPDDQGSYYHVVCIEGMAGVTGDMGLTAAIERVRSQDGILIWAHPHSVFNTVAEGVRHDFHGVEVFNSINQVAFGKGSGAFHWDAALVHQPDMLGFATDDAHFFKDVPAEKGGWIMVNAPDASREAVLSSIRAGNFYSSTGPSLKSLSIEQGNRIVAETSPVAHARLVGAQGNSKYRGAPEGQLMTEAHFRLPDDWSFARLEIEDAAGKMAWSNPLLHSGT
jgi:hypothetical protein